ncbi:MAG: SspB family protein [Bosea sp. (in: a-proteobacteria)]
MSKDLIRYDLMVQDALKGVLRKLLTDAARDGLPGEHHFYITFRTGLPGVRLSQRMRDKYPDEMTIVLQHQFWDLGITEHSFEVGLSFGGVPERLLVPFDAITGFFDPSVQFGLKFEQHEIANEGDDDIAGDNIPQAAAPRALRSVPTASEDDEVPAKPAPKTAAKTRAKAAEGKSSEGKPAAAKADSKKADDTPAEKEAAASDGGAKVLSLDAFRKKT